ncbi:conserved Plasmodium protein, unknown function [Babesia microti strain RI]|uniref:Protein kinase domain-containing protein n=1 Tax=Babesia microti (strain RI) TaxID=1133968 RepID=A0A1R4AA14_BABMR|nr:conserved Plasmodium protein, unknown function [Babesia microti strain RI]SJK85817.1 conserved Plasmodium protein, unknown function [Babesia microti strain RI]|eukprot:XP_021338036.1 conserved Plasmodium protein, unknown function [Babesia microti strain RI]
MDEFEGKSPYRVLPPDHLTGFSNLKSETFDKNIKFFEGIGKYNELLSISEKYLDSIMLDPRIESLQRFVEPLCNITSGLHVKLSNQFDKPVFDSNTLRLIRNVSIDELSTDNTMKHPTPNSIIEESIESKRSLSKNSAPEQMYRVSTQTTQYSCKKRITIPNDAYDGDSDKRIFLHVTNKESDEQLGTFLSDNLEKVEINIDEFIKTCHLEDTKLISPMEFDAFLDHVKPQSLKTDLFNLWCIKPIGMQPSDYLEILLSDDDVYTRLLTYIKDEMNSMGHILDREKQVLSTLKHLSHVYDKFDKEEKLYFNILEKMKHNFYKQCTDVLQCTRQDLRLSIGHGYVQWGRIRNVIDWKPGDKIIREQGFAQELDERNRKKLRNSIRDIFGEEPINYRYTNVLLEGQHMYYKKALNDSTDQEMEWKRLQLSRDRQQVLAEFSSIVPIYCPENCIPWKCVGVSKNNVIWKMFNTYECKPVIVKYRNLKPHPKCIYDSYLAKSKSVLKTLERKFRNVQRNVVFDIKCEINENKLIKITPYINDCTLSNIIENSNFGSPDLIKKVKVIIYQLICVIANLELKFILPLKSSKIYFLSGRVILDVGIPPALLGNTLTNFLKEKTVTTIASELWDKPIEWYLPPEANGCVNFTNQTDKISKAHTYMIGKIFQESIGNVEDLHIKSFLNTCLEPNPENRPTLKALKKFHIFKSIHTNYGLIAGLEVPKVKCAVEVFGDVATIVNNKIRKREKGVADYETLDID